MSDLFSAGFAWGDDSVATAETDDATPRERPNRTVRETVAWDSKGPVAGAATPRATIDIGYPISEKVGKSHLNPAPVAGVATVAETEGQRLERLLSQNVSPLRATPRATAEMAVSCGVEVNCGGAVAPVASVAAWNDGVEAMQRVRFALPIYHGTWRRLVQDARAFMSLWADDAIKAGWNTLDVFGGNTDPLHGRYDRLGLVILLQGRPVQSLDADSALVGVGGAMTTYHRQLRAPGGVPVWQWIRGYQQ